MTERPIFVLACGWRSGSTMLQRLLTTHPQVMIWGENRGVIDHLIRAKEVVHGLDRLGQDHLEEYRKRGSTGWVAAMNPPEGVFLEGLRRLIEAYYREPSREFGKVRWGFKEVRHGIEAAEFLLDLYPESRFILLLRHPRACLASARATRIPLINKGVMSESEGPRGFLDHWRRVASSFVSAQPSPALLLLRYEDLISDPEGSLSIISEHLDLDPSDFAREVFTTRRRGYLGLEPKYLREDVDLLRDGLLMDVVHRCGYPAD